MSADHEIIIFHSNSCQHPYHSNQLANPGGAIWMKCYYQNVSVICFWNGRRKCLTSAENEIGEVCSPLGDQILAAGFLHRLLEVCSSIRSWMMHGATTQSARRFFMLTETKQTLGKAEKHAFTLLLAFSWLVEQICSNFCSFFFFSEILLGQISYQMHFKSEQQNHSMVFWKDSMKLWVP